MAMDKFKGIDNGCYMNWIISKFERVSLICSYKTSVLHFSFHLTNTEYVHRHKYDREESTCTLVNTYTVYIWFHEYSGFIQILQDVIAAKCFHVDQVYCSYKFG